MAKITVRFDGGPCDSQIMAIEEFREYRFVETGFHASVFDNKPAPDKPVPFVEHIYKQSTSDPHIFWYAGSIIDNFV